MKPEFWSDGIYLIAVVFVLPMIFEFFKRRPCWLRPCKKKHLSISVQPGENGCGRFVHGWHWQNPCYVTKWVCERPRCGNMGTYCIGPKRDGAWTIEHGKIVPDEKEWMKW